MKCCVKSCFSRTEANSKIQGITYHRIPVDSINRAKWIKIIRLLRKETDWIPSKQTKVCSKHFKEGDMIPPKKENGHYQLKKDATPVVPMEIDDNGSSNTTEMEIDLGVDTDEEMEEILESPRKHEMRKTIKRLKLVASRRLACIKRLRKKNKRLINKVKKLSDIVKNLKKMRYISEEEEMELNINDEMVSLMQTFQKSFKKKKSFKKFPFALRKFALTLNFYSPAAYRHVRSTLNNCLPHPNTLLNWYDKINGDPGFTKEAFDTLRTKSELAKSPIICNLVLDEMSIRQQKVFDGKKNLGFVDYGTGEAAEEKLASSALVLMAVSLNEAWKIPIGHFFTHGLTGARLANIVTMALKKCAQNKVNIVSVTCDGCQTNIAAMRILGCNFNDPRNLKTIFPHPSTAENVAVFLDACHMLKLVRNTFESKGVFIDKDDKNIRWEHVKFLQEVQEKEGLRAANKLTSRHINFRQQIMKVKLASQLLSNSVAKGLEALRQSIDECIDNEPTQKFIKLHNDVFDVLNTKGDHNAYGYKNALKAQNKDKIFQLIDEYKEYILNLKVKISKKTKRHGQEQTSTQIKHVLDCKFKTGFLGFLVCLESLKSLYSKLVETKLLDYIATYRLSQDHIEIFFGCIRQRGGHNNNPNIVQFKSAYKKLLTHFELKSAFRGNCIPLEKINIISCAPSDPVAELNRSSPGHRDEDLRDEDLQNVNQTFDEEESWMANQNLLITESVVTVFSKQIVAYIAGYVVTKLREQINCRPCVAAMLASKYEWYHQLIKVKDQGGLCYPTQEVFEICLSSEIVIRHSISTSISKTVHPKFTPKVLALLTLEKIQYTSLLKSFAPHTSLHDHAYCLESDHPLMLVNAILQKYIKVRLHHETKMFNISNKKDYKRQVFNKLTLISGV